MRSLIWAAALVVFMAGGVQAAGPRIGSQAPAFTLTDLSGAKVDSGRYRGKTTVLYFWNNLCGCTEQLIALKGFVGARKGTMNFVAVNEGQKKEIIESVILANGLPYQALSDRDLAVGRGSFGIKVLPTVFVVDGRGVVREKLIGILDNKKLESIIQRYL
ncbi:TlpA family protein disulfide reductase [Geomonas subterranea]|uniref:TlpA family protein disulfide reductase n=1 Tax=Geomonas subterranea TaxID=2847989 RepID=UPI001CD2CE2F|nr:redoxin domain-containing protein [Geomonas fuzhouensis]